MTRPKSIRSPDKQETPGNIRKGGAKYTTHTQQKLRNVQMVQRHLHPLVKVQVIIWLTKVPKKHRQRVTSAFGINRCGCGVEGELH